MEKILRYLVEYTRDDLLVNLSLVVWD